MAATADRILHRRPLTRSRHPRTIEIVNLFRTGTVLQFARGLLASAVLVGTAWGAMPPRAVATGTATQLAAQMAPGAIGAPEQLQRGPRPESMLPLHVQPVEIRGPAGRNMWEKLSNVQEEVLANYLKNEYPQTIAVVLSKLKPEHAARVLAILPEDIALDVVGRMLRMEAVQKEVIERVEQTLRTEFMSNLSQTRRRDGGGAASRRLKLVVRTTCSGCCRHQRFEFGRHDHCSGETRCRSTAMTATRQKNNAACVG
jgi:hypothetical protein